MTGPAGEAPAAPAASTSDAPDRGRAPYLYWSTEEERLAVTEWNAGRTVYEIAELLDTAPRRVYNKLVQLRARGVPVVRRFPPWYQDDE